MTVSSREESTGQECIDEPSIHLSEGLEKVIIDDDVSSTTECDDMSGEESIIDEDSIASCSTDDGCCSSEIIGTSRPGLKKCATISMHQDLCFLRKVVSNIGAEAIDRLVAHRGFHDISTEGNKLSTTDRPVENSLLSCTAAWKSGVKHCEVDVLALKDGHLVINHDDDLNRFSLDQSGHPKAKIQKLTYDQVQDTPLVNGLSAPLLSDVLEQAVNLNGKLVAELKFDPKKGNSLKLVELLGAEPSYIDVISVVMSFDLEAVKQFSLSYEEAGLPAERRPKVMFLANTNEEEELFGWGPKAIPYSVYKPPDFGSIKETIGASVDGVYIEWGPELLGQNREEFEKLCSEVTVGVWMYSCDPNDRANVAIEIIKCGAKFVNTDFPPCYLDQAKAA